MDGFINHQVCPRNVSYTLSVLMTKLPEIVLVGRKEIRRVENKCNGIYEGYTTGIDMEDTGSYNARSQKIRYTLWKRESQGKT